MGCVGAARLADGGARDVVCAVAVAVAAGGFRLALARHGIRQHPVVVVASVLPFLVFAAGITLGSAWATWR